MNWVKRQGEAGSEPPRPMPPAIWQVCRARGLTTQEQIDTFFSPRLVDLSHPFTLHDMDKAVERLASARNSQEPVGIYGDFDLDGTPGIVLLYDALSRMGVNVTQVVQPSRRVDGYGLHAHRIAEMHAAGIKLIITVDVGITDIEAVDEANRLGIDVIITDHHLPKATLPKAYAILNPNKGTCTSSLQHLSGTGVAFYLALGLRSYLREKGLLTQDFDPKDLLDLFALATISDQVPLVRENRVLVKHGLHELARSRRPGIRKLLEALGLAGRKLNSKDVAFKVAPKLNALTRLEEGITAREVLLSRDLKEAEEKIALTLEINRKRVEYQKAASAVAKNLVGDVSSYVWVYSHEFHPGVISLLASELLEEYGVPVFVGTRDEKGGIKGSARSPHEGFHLQKILSDTAEVLDKFGGHALAAGFSLRPENEETFRALLESAVNSLKKAPSDRPVFYDAEIELFELTPEFMRWHEEMGPFGQGFAAPVFRMNRLCVEEARELKGGFYKYTFSKNGQSFKAPWFDNPRRFEKGSIVDILFEPQWNEFRGARNIEGLLIDVRNS